MTTTTTDRARLEELLGEYWEIAFDESSGVAATGNKANRVLHEIRALFDVKQAEIARLKAESEERLQNCAALVAEIARLRAALALEPGRKPKPFIGTLKAIYKCTDCGHEQSVTEVHTEHGVYVGSGANWCDKCELGKPERKETP